MKHMKYLLIMLAGLCLTILAGCTTLKLDDSVLIQGTWKGQELQAGRVSFSWLSIVGRDLEFRAVDGQ